MGETSTKAINFAVGIFVTIVIDTLVVASFNESKKVYRLTKNTDTTIHSQFDSIYLTYDGKQANGMELLNTVRKYEDATDIIGYVDYPGGSTIKSLARTNGLRESEQLKKFLDENKSYNGIRYKYENRYKITVKQISGQTVIKFEAK